LSDEVKIISLYEALGEKAGIKKILAQTHLSIQHENILEEPENRVFQHKFSLLILSFIS